MVPIRNFYTLMCSGPENFLHSDMVRNLKNFTLWCGPDLEIFYTLMCSGTDNFLHSDVFRTCEIFTLWCGPELEKFYTLMWTGTEKKLHSDMVHPYKVIIWNTIILFRRRAQSWILKQKNGDQMFQLQHSSQVDSLQRRYNNSNLPSNSNNNPKRRKWILNLPQV